MNDKASKRIPQPDAAKALALFAVILQHAGLDSGPFFCFMTSFHVPLFFALSALFLNPEQSIKEHLKKRTLRLFIPYLVFSIADTAIVQAVSFIKTGGPDLPALTRYGCFFISGFGISVLWFLAALMATELLFVLYLKLPGLLKLCTALADIALFVLICLNADKLSAAFSAQDPDSSAAGFILICLLTALARLPLCLIVYGISFYASAFLRQYLSFFYALRPGVRNLLPPLSAACLLALCAFISVKNGGGSMGMIYYGKSPVLFLLSMLTGCGGMLLLACCICALPVYKPFVFIGMNSLIIMLTHTDFYLLTPARKLASLVSAPGGTIYFILVLLFTLIIELPVIYVINRFFPALIGKRKVAK